MPERIQRKRTSGWRMPPGAVYVGRPTRWGNPFRVVLLDNGRWTVIDDNDVDYREPPNGWMRITDAMRKAACLFLMDVKGELAPYPPLPELRGRDLACWCPLPAPGEPDHCHAAILLALANAAEVGEA